MTASPTTSAPVPIAIARTWIVAVAAIAIVLGLVALLLPEKSLTIIALLFGIYLVVSGIFRVVVAFTASYLSSGLRWFTGILGALVVAAGIMCLNNPAHSIVFIAYVIGFGWIFGGVADLLGGIRGAGVAPRWLTITGGILSIVAGFIIMAVPATALAAFVALGGILLIVVGVGTLITVPQALKRAEEVA
jgi:uncharacterized membrane protein HdeD (DUF308 family)